MSDSIYMILLKSHSYRNQISGCQAPGLGRRLITKGHPEGILGADAYFLYLSYGGSYTNIYVCQKLIKVYI